MSSAEELCMKACCVKTRRELERTRISHRVLIVSSTRTYRRLLERMNTAVEQALYLRELLDAQGGPESAGEEALLPTGLNPHQKKEETLNV